MRLFDALDRFRAGHPGILCDVQLTYRFLDLSTGELDVAIRATADPVRCVRESGASIRLSQLQPGCFFTGPQEKRGSAGLSIGF